MSHHAHFLPTGEHLHISALEQQVLAAVHRFGLASTQTLARLSGLKPHTLRHTIQRLIGRGIVTPFCMINTFALGLKMFSTYLSFDGATPDEEHEALLRAAADPNVNWVARCNGSASVGLSVLAGTSEDALLLLGELNAKMGLRWSRKSFIEASGVYLWPLKSFGVENNLGATLLNRSLGQPYLLDELDHRILVLRREMPLASESALARSLGVPDATTSYRLRRLEMAKVLVGNGLAPCWREMGFSQIKVTVSLNVVDLFLQDELVSFGFQNPDCIGAIPTLGAWDFEFNVISHGEDEATRFTNELYAQFGDKIQEVSVMSITETIKTSAYPFPERQASNTRKESRA